MQMNEIDARGLACPAPVMQTKAMLEDLRPERISVVVDNAAAQQNVQRFLESQGYRTVLNPKGGDFVVEGTRGDSPEVQPDPKILGRGEASQKIMVMCATDRIGFGDDALGKKLMVNFVSTLKEMGSDLWRLVFVNNGVKLSVEGSEVLDDLKAFENEGLSILVCGTCLDHFDLLEKKQVGETTNMLDIVTAMQLAGKVINL
jgi:selenium metabolism protein YedF